MNVTDEEFIGKFAPITDDNFRKILSWRNEPNVRKNMYTQHVISEKEHETWWKKTLNDPAQRYFIYQLNDLELGLVAFTQIDMIKKNASWAFYAAPDAPRGVGTKMEFLALEYAFGELGLESLNCEVLSYNTPVIKLHQRFGFLEKTIQKNRILSTGEASDVHALCIERENWKKTRSSIIERLQKHLKT